MMASDAGRIALDRASVRRIDDDGHLHVERTPISKANICPYRGNEIPGAAELGLDPDKIYQLLRDPAELEKAAASFGGKPLLMDHEPVSADDHPKNRVVGSVGQDVQWEAPYLTAPLAIWDGDAIRNINNGSHRQLSSAYRYTPDMTPGTYEGKAYDGRMTNISGNHVALVEEGRAGPSVAVMDSALKPSTSDIPATAKAAPFRAANQFKTANDQKPKERHMARKTLMTRKAALLQGALMTNLAPKLAQDANIDLGPIVRGVTSKNFAAKHASIIAAVTKATAGKLAADADVSDLADLLDALKDEEPAEDDLDPNSGMPAEAKAEDDDTPDRMAKIREFLSGKLSAEDMKACDDLMGNPAMDAEETDEERKALEAAASAKKAEDDKDPMENMVDKKAMDAAIQSAVADVRKVSHEIEAAREDVRPHVGKIAIACDTAAEVYKAALSSMGVDVAGVHPSAYAAILKAQVRPKASTPHVAMDAKSAASFAERFPGAARIQNA